VRGRYVFGDCTNGRLWSLALDAARGAAAPGAGSPRSDLGQITGIPSAIRLGPDGNVYVAVLQGRIARIAPAGSPPPPPAPGPPASGCASAGGAGIGVLALILLGLGRTRRIESSAPRAPPEDPP